MNLQDWTMKTALVYILLTFVLVYGQADDSVMTWHIGSGDKDETLQFTSENFAGYRRCMCGKATKSCTVFTQDGFMSYVQYGTSDSTTAPYINTYLCQRSSSLALIVVCLRLQVASCSLVESDPYWSFDRISMWESCANGEVKIVWHSSQSFRMNHNNTGVTISSGNVDCPSSPTSVVTTITPTITSTTTISTEISSNATTNDKSSQQNDDGDNTGVIVGVVVAILICGILLAVGFVWWWRKQKTRKAAVNEDNQLSAYPVEIIHGGFNAFPEHRTRANGNAYVPNSSEKSHSSRTATDPVIANRDKAGYSNVRPINNNHVSAFGNTAEYTPEDAQRNSYSRNGHANLELPRPANAVGANSKGNFKAVSSQAERDSIDYEDVNGSDNVPIQENYGAIDHSQEVYNEYEIPVIPAGTMTSGANSDTKSQPKHESGRFKGPRQENMYSEINDYAEPTNNDDIVPPKRINRFLQLAPKAAKHISSVFGLAKSTNDTSDDRSQGSASAGHSGTKTRDKNSQDAGEGNSSKDLYYRGSQTYYELESQASIRLKETDSPGGSRTQHLRSSVERVEDPYEDPDRKSVKI